MTPETFARAKAVFLEAVERPRADRDSFVAEACAGNADLEREVAVLLESEAAAGGFLHGLLPADVGDTSQEDLSGMGPGTRVGAWTILREIGHGGMGTVYLAERADHEYRGQVALKVVRRGMDTDFILQRFRSERQILASLSHPNIARLLDGGTTTDGRPYFAMEYIEGDDLVTWCRTKALSIGDRLALFRTVCGAVQYAHRSLVVHRDIKPSNVLVMRDGTPKLLDFGLAKVLDARPGGGSYLTMAGVGAFTPEYASPEQVLLKNITTASDIYSLGVVLYELVADVHPYRKTGGMTPAEAVSAVCEGAPPLPSRAAAGAPAPEIRKQARLLAGDVDTIVLMALQKEPERRYASAEQLSEDVRRFLVGLPVIARRDTLDYRVEKFVKRHRLGVAAAVVVAVSLVAGAGVALWQARIARRSEALARRRFDDVRNLASSYLFELHDAIRDLPGSTPARALLLRRALEYLDSLSKEAGDDRGILRDLAAAYVKVGDVQGNPYASNLGDTAGARKSYEKAVAILEKLASTRDADPADRLALSTAYLTYGGLLTAVGDSSAGAEIAGKAVAIRQELYAAHPSERQRAVDLAFAHQVRGFSLNATSRYREASESLKAQAALLEGLLRVTPSDASLRRSLGLNSLLLATALRRDGDAGDVPSRYEKAISLEESLVSENPAIARYKRELAISVSDYAGFLAEIGQSAAALGRYDTALALRKSLSDDDPADREAELNVAQTYEDRGATLLGVGRKAQAAEDYRAARGMLESLLRKDPSNARTARLLAGLYFQLADAVDASAGGGAHDEACRLYRRSVDVFRPLAEKNSLSPPSMETYASARKALATCPGETR